MKETRADTRTALLQALGLHVVLFALMFAGLQWTRSNATEPAAGDVIEADLVDPSALSAAMRSALQRQPEQPAAVQPEPVASEPEPLPEPVAEEMPAPVPVPDVVEQEKVQRNADSPEVAKLLREQEEKHRQPEQADLDAKRQSEQERQRQKQLAEIRDQLAKARRDADMAEMRARQLNDARNAANAAAQSDAAASRPRGDPNADSNRRAQYVAAIRDAVLRQWTRPESVPLGVPCSVSIRQIPGGEVVDVQVSPSCPYDELGKRSLEAAILKASPLPYAGFEDVFDRQPKLIFRAEDL